MDKIDVTPVVEAYRIVDVSQATSLSATAAAIRSAQANVVAGDPLAVADWGPPDRTGSSWQSTAVR
jgi:hypothetical protein